MVNYTFLLKLKNSHENYRYTLSLTTKEENNPEIVFHSEFRETMRKNLQIQSSCKITDSDLNQIIKTWIQDIKEGYRDSTITLELRLLMLENIDKFSEKGNQEIPALITPDLSNIEPCFGMLPPLIFT